MQIGKLLSAAISLTSCTLLLAPAARADRRSGLGGNVLIEDPDDLFPFPQTTLRHRNMIRLDYGASASAGNGVLTLGNEREAVAVALHRGDLLSPDVVGFNTELAWLTGVGDAFGASSYGGFVGPDLDLPTTGELVLPATVVDLSYARALGRDAVGVRLGFGRGVRALKDDEAGEVSKGAQTFFAAQLGYGGAASERIRYDASAHAVLAFGKATLDDVDANGGWDLRVGALGRAYYAINPLVDLGVLGNLGFVNEHTEDELASGESNDFAFGLTAALGPSIHLDRAKVAAYGGLRMDVGKNEPNSAVSGDDANRLSLLAPLVNMAVEVQLLDWLYARTGAEYVWQLQRAASDAEAQRAGEGAFRWSAGLGLAHAGFFFDGVVTNGFVTGGPNFIGGTAPGFLAIASLTYMFGDVFGAAAQEPPSGPTTVHPIERPPPAPEPAPAAEPSPPA